MNRTKSFSIASPGNRLEFPLPFRTLPEALQSAPADRPFVTMWKNEDEIQSVTFGEFAALASAQASHLQAEGLKAGDTVILIMPQGLPVMAAFAGAMQLGATPAILAYPNFKVEPAKYRFGLAGVSANLKSSLIMVDDAFPEELMQHVSLGQGARLVRSRASERNTNGQPAFPLKDISPEAIAFIQHSAGTTGLQKGVALSHAAVLRQISHLGPALALSPEDRIYSWLPLYHDMGLVACFILPLVCHLPVVMQSPTDWVMQPGSMLQLISEYRCSLAWVPNFTLQFLARRVPEEDRSGYNLRSLRMMINCSEPVRAASMDEFLSAYPALEPGVLQSSYAMAETVFAVTQSATNGKAGPARIWVDANHLRQHRIVPVPGDAAGAVCLASSGECLPGTEVRVVSDSGEDLPDGHIGEIWIRSDAMLNGYYNRPDLTSQALHQGWYRSGDLGFQWERELYVTGRKKDLIIVAGENLYPQDVEEVVSRHPEIQDGRVVAFGFYNAQLGTEQIIVVAEVRQGESLQRPQALEEQLKAAVAAELGVAARAVYLKPPRWIVKSTAGKPARSTTREKLIAEHPELGAGAGELTSVGRSAAND